MGTYYLKQQWTEVTYNADTGLYEKELRYVDQYGNAHGGVSVYRADEPSKLPQVEYPEEVAYTADALAVLTGGGTGAITAKILGKNALMKAVEGGALAYGRNEIEELLGLPNGIEEILKTVYDTFFREDYNVDYSQISCVFEPENSDEIFRDTLTSTDGTLDNFTLNSEKPNGAVEVLNWDNTGVLYENGAVTATLTLSDADGGKTYSFVDPDGQPTGNSITTFPTGETRSTYQDGTVTLFYPEDETEDPSQVYSITTQPNGIVETRTWDDTGTITELGGTVVAGTVTYGGDYKEVTLMEGGEPTGVVRTEFDGGFTVVEHPNGDSTTILENGDSLTLKYSFDEFGDETQTEIYTKADGTKHTVEHLPGDQVVVTDGVTVTAELR